jgi:Tol biopolymer transport system component
MTTAALVKIRPLAIALASGLALAACTTATNTANTPNGAAPNATTQASTTNAAASTLVDPLSVSTGGFVTGNTDTTTPVANASLAIESRIIAQANETHGNNPGVGDIGNISQVSFAPEGADFDPDVSRDGKTLVFASTQHKTTSNLYIKSIDGRTVTQVTNDPANDLMPRLSPDGTRIAFASDRSGNWDIYVMPVTGGKPIQLTSSASHELHPSWSPDGTEIVFCRLGETSGLWEMWITSVSNPGVSRFIGNGLFPEWCPVSGTGANGADRIAFQKSRERGDRAFGIWTIDYKNGEAGNMTEVASLTTAACINPSWSPDGQWLAYATVPNPGQWTGETRPTWAELWMVDAAGNNRVALTGGKFVNLMPAWGPQGKLYFVSDRGGIENIWSMDTGKVVALAQSNSKSSTAMASHTSTTANPMAPKSSTPVATVPEHTDSTESH